MRPLLLKSVARSPSTRSVNGFTLIEMLIVVAIVGLLAGIAYPSYSDYVLRSRITDALGELGALRVKQEQYYADNRNYGSSATGCSGLVMPTNTYFTFTCTWVSSDQNFLLSATGKSTGPLNGHTFTVNHKNEQRTTAFVGAPAVPLNCWIKRKSETC
jgi:type IV pilus assembly protein PilE